MALTTCGQSREPQVSGVALQYQSWEIVDVCLFGIEPV
jgi:hypothetical protein